MTAAQLTAKQLAVLRDMARPEMDEYLLVGGSRSGKSALGVYATLFRAMKAPRSRHLACRFRRNHAMASLGRITIPSVFERFFPDVRYEVNKSEGVILMPETGSELWIAGLDDEQRMEKILGTEFATVLVDEASQVPWSSRVVLQTRLAQSVEVTAEGRAPHQLHLRSWAIENPPSKAHWTYRYFIEHRDPETRVPISHGSRLGFAYMNPDDNRENLPSAYFDTLSRLPERARRRFQFGIFAEANPSALFSDVDIDTWRLPEDTSLPDMQRIVVGVDPSGQADETDRGGANDAVGICVCGLGVDGYGYVLEDLTVHGGPTVWGRVVVMAFGRHDADIVVGEVNFGGGMVPYVIKSHTGRNGAPSSVPFRPVVASRGKAIRAEPLSALVSDGRIRFAGRFFELEDELAGFTTHGYVGERSPNRADAFVFAMTELFRGVVAGKREPVKASDYLPEGVPEWALHAPPDMVGDGLGWMR